MSEIGSLKVYEPLKQTVDSFLGLAPFIETRLQVKDILNDTYPNLQPGYVAVACKDKYILLIREDIINQSQLMNFLAGARPHDDLGEVIFIANDYGTLENMKTVCLWLDQHINFSNLNHPDNERKQYDINFLNSKNYLEVTQLMHLSIFLELHSLDWHTTQRENQLVQLNSEGKTKEDHELEPQYLHEICANVLGDMMASCKTPIELQRMFPELIRDQSLTTQDKYNIIVNDAWIHGDQGVKFLLNKLKEQSGQQIKEWNVDNSDRKEILKELGLAPDAVINPVRLEGKNDTGIEVGTYWWG
jgi:hypothetical protein